MRRPAVVLLTAALVAALLVAIDLVVAHTVQDHVTNQVSSALDAPAQVELQAWPMTWHLVTGRLPQIDVTAQDVPLGEGEAVIRSLDVRLEGVELRWDELTSGSDELPPAESADFEAELDAASAQALLDISDELVGLELLEDAIALDLIGLVQIEADVDAEDGQIILRPRDALAAFLGLSEIPIDLSDEPGSPHVQEVKVSPEKIVLLGTLEATNSP